jgi:hypothetical protein
MHVTERFKEREFLVLAIVAVLYGWGMFSNQATPEQMQFLEQLLLVTAGGFQVSRGLAKSGSSKIEEPTS